MNRLDALVQLFFDDVAELGSFDQVESADVPVPYDSLLVHEEHMTVAMEAHHESLVDVDVLESRLTDTHYARKILLRRQSDRAVVQFGIMQILLADLSDDLRTEITSQRRPLGRILVRHNVMRTLHLERLWKVNPGAELQARFGRGDSAPTYGRTASIDFSGKPTVYVLEIVNEIAD